MSIFPTVTKQRRHNSTFNVTITICSISRYSMVTAGAYLVSRYFLAAVASPVSRLLQPAMTGRCPTCRDLPHYHALSCIICHIIMHYRITWGRNQLCTALAGRGLTTDWCKTCDHRQARSRNTDCHLLLVTHHSAGRGERTLRHYCNYCRIYTLSHIGARIHCH